MKLFLEKWRIRRILSQKLREHFWEEEIYWSNAAKRLTKIRTENCLLLEQLGHGKPNVSEGPRGEAKLE